MTKELKLKSGKICQLHEIKKNVIPNYFLLAFPRHQGEPSATEVVEMMEFGIEIAQKLSRQLLDNENAFTILYSGYSARREKGWHVHIVLLGNRWRKGWLYLVLAIKNLLQAIGLRKDDAPKI